MIFISAGHYPSHPGAKYDRFIEHDEACIWMDMLVERINANGDDESPAVKSMKVPTGVLKSKVEFINERALNGDVAVEIHFNAATNAKGENVGRGCETLYYPGSEAGKVLATLCQDVLAIIYPPDRGVKEGWYRMDPARGADFFLAKTKCPAVILEPEFVHRSELIIENRETAVDKLAAALTGEYNGHES